MTQSPHLLTDGEIKEIRERERKATEGPWLWDGDETAVEDEQPPYIYRKLPEVAEDAISVLWDSDWGDDADADFIAHARQDIPRLLADREELVRQRDAMRNGLVALQKKFLRVFGKESIEIDEILSSLTLP